MKVLIAHNRYQQAGGEDAVFQNEVELLRGGGHDVSTLVKSNEGISGLRGQTRAATRTIWSRQGYRDMAQAISRHKPEVVHVHNFFPVLSPSIFSACNDANTPVVWTLHNFRVTCANGLLFRNGTVCEKCVSHSVFPAIRHRCYRGSPLGSATVASMIAWHRFHGTWKDKVSRFIALNSFARDLYVRSGIPENKISIKPNFVQDPQTLLADSHNYVREGALFVGRLSSEKGLDILIRAWRSIPHIRLTIIGDGPERAAIERNAPPNVHFAGYKPSEEVRQAMAGAKALIVPSTWYENFPMTVVEAMALGTPVVASKLGALDSIIRDGANGLHFTPGDAEDLAAAVRRAFASPSLLEYIGSQARLMWEQDLSPQRNLTKLLEIYRMACAQ